MRRESRTVEQKIALIASVANGIATRAEMLGVEISGSAIDRRVRKGLLIVQYPGVYRVGHCAPSLEAAYMAAVRACGEGAFLSGRAAGHLHGLLKGSTPPPEVTTPTERRIKGLRTKRERDIDRCDVTAVRGIPVTTVPRTIADLAAVLSLDDLARACHEAGVRYRTTPRQVEAVLSRRPTTPGARKLRLVIHGDVHVTLSELERAFITLIRRLGLPLPIMNRVAGGRRVDCRWPEYGVTVELDSYRYHNSRYAWEEDRRREREARARGDEFRRYTWHDIVEDPGATESDLRRLLSAKVPV
jgi:hypothetical protein